MCPRILVYHVSVYLLLSVLTQKVGQTIVERLLFSFCFFSPFDRSCAFFLLLCISSMIERNCFSLAFDFDLSGLTHSFIANYNLSYYFILKHKVSSNHRLLDSRLEFSRIEDEPANHALFVSV